METKAKCCNPARAGFGAHSLMAQSLECSQGPRTERGALSTHEKPEAASAAVYAYAPVLLFSAVR